jgi:hypothetical protein
MRPIEPLGRTADEVVAEIVQALEAGSAIETQVRSLIDASRFLKSFGPLVGNRKANAKFARVILKWINDGEKLLAEFPHDPKEGSAMLELLFGPKQTMPVNSPERLEALIRQAGDNYEEFSARLQSLRQRCEWIIRERVGEHGSAGYLQERAAIAARYLCEKAGKPLAWSSPTSAFRKVASFFYEVMTGQADCEMERACELIAARADTDRKAPAP